MDKVYWDQYYKNSPPPLEPSPFAMQMAEQYLSGGQGTLLELGCGNGRDSLYFQKQGLQVTAIDESEYAIKRLQEQEMPDAIRFMRGDFVQLQDLALPCYRYVYSRFTLHSITEEQEHDLFQKVWNQLEPDGLFLIEARSVRDELFGQGELVARNSYIHNGHFRRFLVLEELTALAERQSFAVKFADQQRGWAVYGAEDPIVIRLVLQKK